MNAPKSCHILPFSPFLPEELFHLEPSWSDPRRAFGNTLRRARLHAGLTRRQFARLTGMHPTDLRGAERGWQVPDRITLPRIEALAAALQCPDLVAAFFASHEVLARQQHRARPRRDPLPPQPAPGTGYSTPFPHLRRLDIILAPAPRP